MVEAVPLAEATPDAAALAVARIKFVVEAIGAIPIKVDEEATETLVEPDSAPAARRVAVFVETVTLVVADAAPAPLTVAIAFDIVTAVVPDMLPIADNEATDFDIVTEVLPDAYITACPDPDTETTM